MDLEDLEFLNLLENHGHPLSHCILGYQQVQGIHPAQVSQAIQELQEILEVPEVLLFLWVRLVLMCHHHPLAPEIQVALQVLEIQVNQAVLLIREAPSLPCPPSHHCSHILMNNPGKPQALHSAPSAPVAAGLGQPDCVNAPTSFFKHPL